MNFKYLVGAAAVVVGMPMLVNGCSSDPLGALCCKDFTVGADMTNVDFGVDASVKGQFAALAQASGDLSGAASDMLTEVGNSCRAIAIDLGATDAEQTAAEAKSAQDSVGEWCNLASAKITASLGGVKLTIKAEAPKCEASFKAEASCQGSCSVDGKCDVNATPPTCEGGKLEVSCSGKCDVTATAPKISCKGSCTGKCEGSCVAQGGVQCNGTCEGTCTGNTAAGTASGKCEGTCNGKCSVTAPGVQCTGQCDGQCDAACEATPGSASVQCDGQCSAKATPISCKGGTLKASCQVDAKCDANCKASAQAKAECTPGQLTIDGTGGDKIQAVIDTLKLNLPRLLLAIKVRGEAVVNATGSISGSLNVIVDPGKLGVKGSACLVSIGEALVQATGNAKVAVEGGGKVTASAGVN
jgi:hypothetical protein